LLVKEEKTAIGYQTMDEGKLKILKKNRHGVKEWGILNRVKTKKAAILRPLC
jgi:hypothetical protein